MGEHRRLPAFIPNRLRRHRRMRGLTQRQVAELLGVRNATRLAKWERGESMPDCLNLIKLSVIYRVLPLELYFELYQECKREVAALEWQLFGEGLEA